MVGTPGPNLLWEPCRVNVLIEYENEYKVYVVVYFLSLLIFVFLLFLGMVMYANEVQTKEK